MKNFKWIGSLRMELHKFRETESEIRLNVCLRPSSCEMFRFLMSRMSLIVHE